MSVNRKPSGKGPSGWKDATVQQTVELEGSWSSNEEEEAMAGEEEEEDVIDKDPSVVKAETCSLCCETKIGLSWLTNSCERRHEPACRDCSRKIFFVHFLQTS